MATQTPNLNLVLPDYADKADIGVVNDNFKKIDDFSGGGKVEEWLDSIQEKADESLAKIAQDATSYLNNIQKEANESLNEIENKAKNSLESIPDDYEVLASDVSSLKDHKADVIIDTSARADSHALYAQDGDINVKVYGLTTEAGVGDKSASNPFALVGVSEARIHCGSKNLYDPSIRYNGNVLGVGGSAKEENGVFSITPTSANCRIWAHAAKNESYGPQRGALLHVRNGNTFTVSFSNTAFNQAIWSEYDKNRKQIGFKSLQFSGGKFTTSIINNGAEYVSISFGVSNATIGETYSTKIQVEYGMEATEFEPYRANILDLTHLLNGNPLHGNAKISDTVENNVEVDGQSVARVTRRWGVIESYAGETIPGDYISSTGGLDTGAYIVYLLDSPVVNISDPVKCRKPDMIECVTVAGVGQTVVVYPHDTKHYIDAGFDASAYSLPVLYLSGETHGMSKDDSVELAYRYNEYTGNCTVKWQGSSSIAWPKKNYTIKFDQAFEAKTGWGTQKKYCFKANFIDHSHARNVCSCKLWGEIVKSRANVPTELTSLPNGGAIDGFPCVIVLNGEFHGLYTWNIPKDGWMFGNPKAILCADAHVAATQFKALATLDGDFELEYVEDENNAEWVLPSINTAIQAVMNSNGSDIDTVVGQYIDIASAIDYYIHTVDEAGHDDTDKNYILVTFDGVKWYFSAYDRDSIYGLDWAGRFFHAPNVNVTYADYANVHRMMWLIRNHKTSDLKARAIELRNGVKSEANVATMFTNFTTEIPSQIFDEDARKWPTIPATSTSNVWQILNWYRLRRITLDAEIDAM